MKKGMKKIYVAFMVLAMLFMVTPPVFALAETETAETDVVSDEAVDAACGVKIVYTDVLGEKIRVPCGISGGEKRVDRAM